MSVSLNGIDTHCFLLSTVTIVVDDVVYLLSVLVFSQTCARNVKFGESILRNIHH